MYKFAWCTDIHLDFLKSQQVELEAFASGLKKDNPDAILITGDIANANSLVYNLSVIERIVERPIYFVCGNHDYYGSSVEAVRKTLGELNGMSQYLKYLPQTPYAVLTPTTALVGHDGWYDALNGDFNNTRFVMNDWSQIQEFAIAGAMPPQAFGGSRPNYGIIASVARKFAHEATTHIMQGIKAAARYHKVIIVATHVPPFEVAHIFKGKLSDATAHPWYTSQMMGSMLLQAAKAYPNIRFEVYAGHTHGKSDVKIEHNLYCHVGGAEYYYPHVQSVIQVP